MTSFFTKTKIRDLFSDNVYRRGVSYYKQGRVKELVFDPVRMSWNAKVKGTTVYRVTVREDEDDVETECNCPAFDQYLGSCKHVAAVLIGISEYNSNKSRKSAPSLIQQPVSMERRKQQQLEKQRQLEKQMQERQNKYVKQLTIQFIDALADQPQGSFDQAAREPLLVEWICKIQKPYYSEKQTLTLEMKVGQKRAYVVKNIKDFLSAVSNEKHYFFTKNFTYDPAQHDFAEEDKAIIHLLENAIKYEEIYQEIQYPYYRSTSSQDERSVTISPMVADGILEQFPKISLRFENNGRAFHQVNIFEHALPFTIQLDKGRSNDFQLDLSELLFTEYLELYGYLVKEDAFYKLTSTQQALIKELKKLLGKTNSPLLPIGGDQIDSFLSHVAPRLNNIGKLKIASNISSQIVKLPLQAKVFVDRMDELLHVSLEYHYGDNKINPFHPAPEEKGKHVPIIIRDAEKERAIMDVMESGPLKFNRNLLYVEGEEGICEFLYESIPRLEDKAEVFLTNAVKSLLLPDRQNPVASIDVDSSGDLLEVSFNMDGIDKEEIHNILRYAVEKKKYYRLSSGAFVSLESEKFQTVQNIFQELNIKPSQLQGQSIQLPLYRGIQLEGIVDKEKYAKYGKQFRRLINRLKNPEELDFEIPGNLQAELREYQNYGFQWLKTLHYYRLGGILADDMGLGKTLQSIAFILSEKERNKDHKPALIVAPASLVYNWKNECQKFAPSLNVEVMIGSVQDRMNKLQDFAARDVWITSYPTLRQDIDNYRQQEFSILILDEAQTIKNYATKTAKAVRDVHAGTRFALSGTPIENSIDELWSIFQTIMPDFFPAQKAFRQLAPEKVAKMIRPFILRRLKADVLKELPEKIETVHYSDLSKQQKELYLAFLEKIKAEAKESLQGEGFQKSRIKILAGLTRLRQLCCHPALFLENYQGDSGKLRQLIDIATNAVENGRRLLIFSQFTSMLSIIGEEFTNAGLDFFYLDGQTAPKDRVKMVDQFNQGEASTFLISLKAGNTGLNLTGADTVILYDLWWNPAVEEQAAGRAHRIGQKNVVQVIRLITQGTIEEKIFELQQNKKELIETVIQPGDQEISKITEADIREILNI